jgi:hypothetical protein
VSAGDGPTLIQNSDVINTVFLGDNSAIKTTDQQGIAPLGPQASVVVNGNDDVFATCGAGQSVVVYLFPGGMYLSPPPAEVALAIADSGLALESTLQATNTTLGSPAQDGTVSGLNTGIPNHISTTGVPLLNLSTALANGSNIGVTAGSSNSTAIFSINQPSFELGITSGYAVANGATPYTFIVLYWIDPTSGLTIAKDTFVIWTATHAGIKSLPFIIRGPSKAGQVQMVVFNLDAAQNIEVTYTLLADSRVIPTETIALGLDWKEDSASIQLFTNNATRVLPDSNVIGTFVNSALAASGTDTWITPPASGLAYLNFTEAGASAANMAITVTPVPSTIYGGINLVNDIMVAGNPNKLTYTNIVLPNGPLQVQVKNNGTGNANYAGMLVANGQT